MFRASVRCAALLLLSACVAWAAAENPVREPVPGEPSNPKARKTWKSAVEFENHYQYQWAISSYRKANQQDGGHCLECLRRAYRLAAGIGAFGDAEAIAREMLPSAASPQDKARVHYLIGTTLQRDGIERKRSESFTRSCDEFRAALELDPELQAAHFQIGVSLARLHQDQDALREFAIYIEKDKSGSPMRSRAQRYLGNLALARAPMAPPFSITTLDGKHVSLDDLAGKVVLIDFWATWCGPCITALPRIRRIAQQSVDQPLVVLSISLDQDEAKWKDFIAKNQMTWLQYRDDGVFDGPIVRQFHVNAIPATFTIDADGVLEDQHVGDADIERKLKKLVAHAAELASSKPSAATPAAEN